MFDQTYLWIWFGYWIKLSDKIMMNHIKSFDQKANIDRISALVTKQKQEINNDKSRNNS